MVEAVVETFYQIWSHLCVRGRLIEHRGPTKSCVMNTNKTY